MEHVKSHADDSMRCPACRQWMQSGCVAISQGVLWMRNADAASIPFSESVPGTNALTRANRLPAWRCQACELMLFRFGREVHKERDRAKLATGSTDASP